MSNSILYDDNAEPGNLDQLKKDLAEATTSEPEQKEAQAEKEQEIPEKYRGKSMEDIIEMHRNAESELGRRGNELGQYKKLTDELLDLKRREDLTKGGASADEIEDEPLPEISSSDLLENPTESISKLLSAKEKSSETKRQRKEAEEKRLESETKFAQAYPNAEEIVQDPKFVEWVQGSTARSLLGYQASQGDLTAGAALLDEWSAATSEPAEEPKKDDPISDARKASTESKAASSTPDAPNGKVYRRTDLIRLKLQDPEAYADEGFQREIMRAYAEGRVK